MSDKPTDKTLIEVHERLKKAYEKHSELKVSYRPNARDFIVSRPASAGATPSYEYFALKGAVERLLNGLPVRVVRLSSGLHHAVTVGLDMRKKPPAPKVEKTPPATKQADVLFVGDNGDTWGGCDRLHLELPGDKRYKRLLDKHEEDPSDECPNFPDGVNPLDLFRIVHLLLKGDKLRAELAAAKLPGARKIMEADESVFLKPSKRKA